MPKMHDDCDNRGGACSACRCQILSPTGATWIEPAASRALDESAAARELFCELALLLGHDPVLDGGPDGIPDVGVIDPTTGDVIGAGPSLDEALAEALATVRG